MQCAPCAGAGLAVHWFWFVEGQTGEDGKVRNTRLLGSKKRLRLAAGFLGLLMVFIAGWQLFLALPGKSGGLAWASGTSGPPDVVCTYGVGGVLTADGTLWQYRPDLDKWLTIDEAFRQEGRETAKVLPLPVPADQIADMATWGFILSKSGDLWLYEMASDSWRHLDPPRR